MSDATKPPERYETWLQYAIKVHDDICDNLLTANELATILCDNERMREELDDWRDGVGRIMEERCSANEHHCTCVPTYRKQLASLRAENEKLATIRRLVESVGEMAREAVGAHNSEWPLVDAYFEYMGPDCDHNSNECPDGCPRLGYRASETLAKVRTREPALARAILEISDALRD